VITPGFRLKARRVIHAVGPIWRGGGAGEPALLADAYRASLARLREEGGRSIAFPAISTGAYGFPPELATPLAVATVREVLAAYGPLEVVFACHDERMLALYRKELGA
jgi:O-acetyl-ADP-ribose deacetylase (regulator of RNase III)